MRRKSLPVIPQVPAPVTGAGTVLSPGDAVGTRIGLITLGCDKNTVDSERVMGRLQAAGARMTDPENADVVIINTCGFIDQAKEESIDTILDAVRMKAKGNVRAVVAVGCLVQRYQQELEQEIPEVDLFLGLSQIDRLVPELQSRGLLNAVPTMERPLRVLSTHTRHSSYLKISEGCDHTCAFCAIPLMRGKHRSTPIDVLVREAQDLEKSGIVELNIISQDTTWYGRDLQRGAASASEFFMGRAFEGMAGSYELDPRVERTTAPGAAGRGGMLPDLLRTLISETTIPWFRLFYMYPSGISRELIQLMAEESRILPYLDMPIQHGSNTVLERMRRPERQQTIRERTRWLREALPNLSLRTTVIVGFPGETEDEFEEMLALLEEIRFDHLGAFTYSVEEGTRAAVMGEHVPDAVKRERMERLLDLQRGIKLEKNDEAVGRLTTLLVDEYDSRTRTITGRTVAQALEVDSVVRIEDADYVSAGEFLSVQIVDVADEDLVGRLN